MRKKEIRKTMKHANSMLLRVLLSAFSAVAMLTLSLLAIYISTFRVTVEKEFQQLVQTSVSNIEMTFSQYANIANSYCRNFYNSVDGVRLRVEDEYKMAYASSLRYDIQKSFDVIPFAHSVCVIDQNNQLKGYVTNSNRKSYTNDFNQLLPPRLDESPGQLYPIFWNVSNAHTSDHAISLLTFYTRDVSPYNERYSGAVTVNLDTHALSQVLFGDMDSDGVEYFVMNHEGYVVAHSNPARCGDNMLGEACFQDILTGTTQFENITTDGVEYQIYSVPASVENFYIVAQSEYLSELSQSKRAILLIVLLTIAIDLAAAVFLYIVCSKIFKPFNRIVLSVKQSELLTNSKQLSDDLTVLSQYHTEVSSYVEHQKEVEYRNQIVKAMLKRKEVDFLLIKHGYIQPEESYYLLLLHIGKELNDVIQLPEYDRIRADLEMLCLESFDNCTCFEVGFRRIMVLINNAENGDTSLEGIKDSVSRIQSQISEDYSLLSTAFVSNQLNSNMSDRTCTASYHFADSCMKTYRFLDTSTPIVLLSEKKTNSNWKMYMDATLQQVQRQDKGLFEYNLEQMFAVLKYQPWDIFSHAVLKLSKEITKIRNTEELSVDYSRALADKVRSMTDKEQLCSWLNELFDDTTSWLQTISDHSSAPIMEKVITYIENHYSNQELNLNMLAKQMHISAPYLGKLFHSFTGSSFNGYLTQIRMEHARDLLLLERDSSIASIAAQVGYSNSSYFASTFKNFYGVSPSTYRNNYDNQKQ